MSNKNEQNGRQPPLPGQPPPSLENEANHENGSTSSDKMEICRNFVWGSCNKNTQCKFRHELDFEEMKKILKFCHDYQNPPGCTREHCTYLHTTKEEESLFFATGQLPRVLAERHANMSATAAETIPQIALFIQESFVGPPPPPPPPPAPAPAPAPVAVPPPIAPTSLATKPALPMMPMQQLPPPPPPPPPVSSAMPVQQHASVFPASAVQVNPAYTMNTPPPAVHVLFDASRPPPPIPTHVPTKNNIKRPSPTNFDVQPKKRKVDEVKVADGHCDQCVQRDIRVESCKQEMDKLCGEEEYNTLIYKKKLEEYQNRKELLRSLVSNDLYRLIEEYVEGIPQLQVNDVLTQLNQTPFVSGTSSVPKQFLLQLMEYVLENSRVDAVPSSTLRLDESLLQSLSRRTNSVGLSSPDVLQTFMEILRQSNAPERVQATDLPGTIPRCTTLTTSTSTNSSQRYSNGQNRSEQHVNRMAPPTPQVPPPPPPYHHYPAPPARLYYPPPFPVPTSGAVATSQLTRVPPPPAPAPPAAPAPPPAPSCHPYTTTRYPPPFYQRHQ